MVAQSDPPEPVRPPPLPKGTWQDVTTDLLGPLVSGHFLLVVNDYYSTYYEVRVLKSTKAEQVIDHLEYIFHTHGVPWTLKSDNRPQFRSEAFATFF